MLRYVTESLVTSLMVQAVVKANSQSNVIVNG